ncbi:hypothetical protein BDZ91DRAFT_785611 [Kalaharituber pfeilii]|nr:hypothetical protein BDZ91DRAFT_785611 [Kalaharituber pfeilii]
MHAYGCRFKSSFDPELEQNRVAPGIVDLIGGDESGGAIVTSHEKGMGHDSLKTISNICNPPEEQEEEEDGSNKTSIGAIMGGAVQGVVAAALIGFIAFSSCRRRSRERPGHREHIYTSLHEIGFELSACARTRRKTVLQGTGVEMLQRAYYMTLAVIGFAAGGKGGGTTGGARGVYSPNLELGDSGVIWEVAKV